MNRMIAALAVAVGAILAVSVPAQAATAPDQCAQLRAQIVALQVLANQQTIPQAKTLIEASIVRLTVLMNGMCPPPVV